MKTMTIRGRTIPRLGFGTWQLKGADCTNSMRVALDVGYRHIDTARAYGNEAEVGAAIAESGVAAEDLYITTKVWRTDLSPEGVVSTVESSLVKLQLDRIDNVLLHWPNPEFAPEASLDALARCKERGLIEAYGVSNYPPQLFRRALEHDPAVQNIQVENHVFLEQEALRTLCVEHDAFLTAYSPLARGQVMHDADLAEIAEAHGTNAAAVAIAWLLARDNVAVIPKATGRGHIESNWAAQDLELTAAQVSRIDALRKNDRLIDPDFGPTWEPRAAHL